MKLITFKENEDIELEHVRTLTPAKNQLFSSVIKHCQDILDITHQNFYLTAAELNIIRKQLRVE